MNIGIFTNNYLPNPYGVTGSIESFREIFEKQGHTVYIFAPFWKGYCDENHRVFRYPSLDIKIKFRFPLAIPYSWKMDKLIDSLDLDIIHSQHPNLLGTAAKKWARKKNIPLVFTWHTLYDQYTNFAPFLPRAFTANWIIKKVVRYANSSDALIAPTQGVADKIKGWGVRRKINVIPTGVIEAQFENPDRKKIRDRYGIRDNEILLVLISRLTEEKNVEFLLRALVPVIKKHTNVKFLLGGEGYLAGKIKTMAKKSNIKDSVIFSGLVSREEVKNYLLAGDIFVHASKSETQGMILSEAMYMGLPIVAINATGANDLIENNVSGLLVKDSLEEFSQGVKSLIDNSSLRKNLGKNAKRIAGEKYASKVCAGEMLIVYEKAIKNPQKQTK